MDTQVERSGKTARWLLAGLVAIFGLVMMVLLVFTRRINPDSAVLFVVMPIALAITMIVLPVKTTYGRMFQVTTIFLLLTAVAAHEGAICVLLVAPLVYGIAIAATAAVIHFTQGRRRYALVLPLLLISGVEGVDDDVRFNAEQAVNVVRTVQMAPAQVARRIEVGPLPVEYRSMTLRLLNVPQVQSISGVSLEPGAQWTFAYHGSSHGSGGHTIFQVEARDAGSVSFRIVEDSAITARWFDWRTATISWHEAGPGATTIRLSIVYERGLDPSWYFGPLTDGLMHEGAEHFLDMLGMR